MNSVTGCLCCREEKDSREGDSWHFFTLVLVDVGVAGLYKSLTWHDDSTSLCEQYLSFIPTKWCVFVQSSFLACPPVD